MARAAPAMARKGRLTAGSDADITVFNPRTVADRATFKNPKQFSTGVRWVLVNGTPVVREGRLITGARPGRPVWGRGRRQPIAGTRSRRLIRPGVEPPGYLARTPRVACLRSPRPAGFISAAGESAPRPAEEPPWRQ